MKKSLMLSFGILMLLSGATMSAMEKEDNVPIIDYLGFIKAPEFDGSVLSPRRQAYTMVTWMIGATTKDDDKKKKTMYETAMKLTTDQYIEVNSNISVAASGNVDDLKKDPRNYLPQAYFIPCQGYVLDIRGIQKFAGRDAVARAKKRISLDAIKAYRATRSWFEAHYKLTTLLGVGLGGAAGWGLKTWWDSRSK